MVCRLVCPSTCTHPTVRPVDPGIVVILFFQCIGALINPANDTRRSVKLGLAAYAVALFLIPTIPLVAGRDVFPTVFIDIRNFPGTEEYPPGPLGGAMISNASDPWVALLGIPAPVSQWLSNGFLVSSVSSSAACGRYSHPSSYIVAMRFIP